MEKSKSRKPLFVTKGYFDYQTLFLIFVIVLFGLLMVYSSSSYRASVSGLPDTYFVKRQALFAVIGFVLMIAISHINYKQLKRLSVLLMCISTALLLLVLFIGTASHGATRWIPIGPIQFQPSEIAKPALIIYTAHICSAKGKMLNSMKGLIKLTLWPAICVILIGVENLSTAIVCFMVVLAIIFVASPRVDKIVILIIIVVVLGVIGVFAAGYRSDRFDAWLHPETSESGFQTLQSLYAIGSGGFFGRGLGQSIQKMGFLPESHNDMIFSVICEELGLFGALCVIALFLMLIFRFKYIADNCYDSFGGFIITGVLTHVAVQLLVNIGVVTNTIPPTGVTLPFISYGGTSLVFLLAEVGLVLSVSRQIKPYEKSR